MIMTDETLTPSNDAEKAPLLGNKLSLFFAVQCVEYCSRTKCPKHRVSRTFRQCRNFTAISCISIYNTSE